jgi:hypothetical protein
MAWKTLVACSSSQLTGIIEYNYCSDLSGYAVFSALIMEKNPHFRW